MLDKIFTVGLIATLFLALSINTTVSAAVETEGEITCRYELMNRGVSSDLLEVTLETSKGTFNVYKVLTPANVTLACQYNTQTETAELSL